jgi:tetratricopeptide (TPR) repeat protein
LYTPQRLFGEVRVSSEILIHEPFLERARHQREQERDGQARLALGGYIVARLVDKLLTVREEQAGLEGFRWQLEAVRRHVSELPADAPETAHLAGIVDAIPAEGPPPPSSLWKSLTAYAYFLEHEARFEEGLEVLNLAARAQGNGTSSGEYASYALFAGRLNRQLTRWDIANTCYNAAEEAASASGDFLTMLRAGLGRGAVHRGQGNYPAARNTTEKVLREAIELGLVEAQAMAYADLGVIYSVQGHRLEALKSHYKAFRLTPDPVQRMRVLGDLALGLHEIGAYEPARLGFQIVVESNASVEVRTNALLELMDLESSLGNRVAFERYRVAAEQYRSRMSPRMTVDYLYKIGVGLARFGQVSRARSSLATALEMAERHQLNAWVFKIESAINELIEGKDNGSAPSSASELSESPVVREMEEGLREYALASAS